MMLRMPPGLASVPAVPIWLPVAPLKMAMPDAAFAGDDIARRRADAADGIGSAGDEHTEARVGDGRGAVLVRTDVVALDDVVAAKNVDAVAMIAGDHVACTAHGTADGVAGGAVKHGYAAEGVTERGGTVDVGADVISLHDVADGRRPDNADTFPAVARKNITRLGDRATDSIARSILNIDAAIAVAQRDRARDVGADEVALHQVVGGAGPDTDAFEVGIAGDDIAGARRGAA